LSRGHDFKKSGEFASLAAAKVVSQFGPRLKPEQHAQLKKDFFNSHLK